MEEWSVITLSQFWVRPIANVRPFSVKALSALSEVILTSWADACLSETRAKTPKN